MHCFLWYLCVAYAFAGNLIIVTSLMLAVLLLSCWSRAELNQRQQLKNEIPRLRVRWVMAGTSL
jgi:hypothetical protein